MKNTIVVALLAVMLMGMGNPGFDSTQFGAGKEGLVSLLSHLAEVPIQDRAAFSRTLSPSKEDCEAIFVPSMALKMYHWEKKLYRRFRPVVTPFSSRQTELACWQSGREELLAYEGEARYFPGGYREIASFLNPGVKVYRVKYLEPGRKIGAAYDVFVYVNGHWVLLWQPWRLTLQ
ncbi:MAG: hypothetical protein NWR72_03170 [Bacteroidia bacterium]|nr:hypothetical protein [Bacteroidia bacterium]